MEESRRTIYGLDFHARTLGSLSGEWEGVGFVVGTQSLRAENQLCVLELEEDSGAVRKTSFAHPKGELWHLAPHPTQPALVAASHSRLQGSKLTVGADVYRLDLEGGGGSETRALEEVTAFCPATPPTSVQGFQWSPSGAQGLVLHDAAFTLVDAAFQGRQMREAASGGLERKTARLGAARWDPHSDGRTFLLAQEASVAAVDARSLETAWRLDSGHAPVARDLDLNPNRQYVFATAGDDSKIRWWDSRRLDGPLGTVAEHSHWVWALRFNPVHDQLLLSASSDARVLLHSQPALSSEPSPAQPEEGEEGSEGHGPLPEGVVSRVEEHEESVYACAWSEADPWTFASLSYDGRLILSHVPRSLKYHILQL